MVVFPRQMDLLRPMMVGSLIRADHPGPEQRFTLSGAGGDITGGGKVGNQFEMRPVFGS